MERLQILVTAEQRRGLVAAAAARSMPVTALVREAIDLALPQRSTLEDRRAALRVFAQADAEFLSVEEIDRILEDRFDIPDL